jgi:hypothetical protein
MSALIFRRFDLLSFIGVGIVAGILPIVTSPLIGLGVAGGLLAMVFIFRNPRIGLFLVALTIPLETVGNIGAITANLPLTVPKLFTVATLLSWLINLASRRLMFRSLPWMYYLPGFMVACTASLFGAEEIRSGIEAVVRFSNTVIFFFLIVQLLDTDKVLKTCLILFIVSSTLFSSWSIIQRFLPGSSFAFRYGWEEKESRRGGIERDTVEQKMVGVVERSSGLTAHPILLAFNIGLLIAPLVAFTGMIKRQAVLMRLAYLAMLGVLLGSVVVTYSRTGFVILLFSFALMVWRGLIQVSVAKLMAILLLVVVFVIAAPEKYIDRVLSFNAYTTKSASISTRLDITKGAISQFLDHPILGVGYGNRYGIFQYYTSYRDKKHAVTPHNSYVQVASQTGLVGLIVLLLFFKHAHHNLCYASSRYAELGRPDMAQIGRALDISLLVFLFAGLALDLFDKGIAHAWMIIGTGGAFVLLSREAEVSLPAPVLENAA